MQWGLLWWEVRCFSLCFSYLSSSQKIWLMQFLHATSLFSALLLSRKHFSLCFFKGKYFPIFCTYIHEAPNFTHYLRIALVRYSFEQKIDICIAELPAKLSIWMMLIYHYTSICHVLLAITKSKLKMLGDVKRNPWFTKHPTLLITCE